jgi:hypothetical protein
MTTGLLFLLSLLIGVLVAIFLPRKADETRLENFLMGFIASLSIPWLYFSWNYLVKTPGDARIFLTAFVIYLFIWTASLFLIAKGEKYLKVLRVFGLMAMAPMYVHLFRGLLDKVFQITWFSSHQMELMIDASLFGIFWITGLWIKKNDFVFFKDR